MELKAIKERRSLHFFFKKQTHMQERGDEVLIQKVHHKFHLKEKVFANSSPSYDLSHSPIYQTINM